MGYETYDDEDKKPWKQYAWYIGKITRICRKDGSEYEPDNWRLERLNLPGSGAIYGNKNRPGEYFMQHVCGRNDDSEPLLMTTSSGPIEVIERRTGELYLKIRLTTRGSIYEIEWRKWVLHQKIDGVPFMLDVLTGEDE
jgi:hypothetical protein